MPYPTTCASCAAPLEPVHVTSILCDECCDKQKSAGEKAAQNLALTVFCVSRLFLLLVEPNQIHDPERDRDIRHQLTLLWNKWAPPDGTEKSP